MLTHNNFFRAWYALIIWEISGSRLPSKIQFMAHSVWGKKCLESRQDCFGHTFWQKGKASDINWRIYDGTLSKKSSQAFLFALSQFFPPFFVGTVFCHCHSIKWHLVLGGRNWFGWSKNPPSRNRTQSQGDGEPCLFTPSSTRFSHSLTKYTFTLMSIESQWPR